MLGRIIALLMKLGELQRLVCKMDIVSLLEEFADLIRNEEVEVYNEFSLQHELGIFLRAKLTGNKVQFERNTKFFGITGTVKHGCCSHAICYPYYSGTVEKQVM